MRSFKLAVRIAFNMVVVIVSLCVVGFIGLSGMSRANDGLKTVYEDRLIALAQLSEAQRSLVRNRLWVDRAGNSEEPGDNERMIKLIAEDNQNVNKQWADYMATYLTPEEAQYAKEFEAARATYIADFENPAIAMIKADDDAKLRAHIKANSNRMYQPVLESMHKLIQLQVDVGKSEYETSVARYETTRTVLIALCLVMVSLSSLAMINLLRQFRRAMQLAVDTTESVAKGDLTTHIPVDGNDEVTQLMKSLEHMQTSLSAVVGKVREGSESVSNASAEIAQGNQDLSARTESQASALEETAASMEELSSTVQHNADSAQQARQLSASASVVAAKGGEMVSQVVQTMREINDSSRRIADIISVIDGIAFQTNILALNAAVEAARAGEQGRGFAVVASEVRALAGRSAEAAKEIKSLITASVEKVEQGSAQVDVAGSTMQEVVAAIQRVNDLMGEISAASNQQAAGVSQVGEAVTEMDQTTQQNAALVEEMAAAAASLKTQAQDLVQAVAVFQLSAGETTTSRLQVRALQPVGKPFAGTERRAAATASVSKTVAKPTPAPAPAAPPPVLVAVKPVDRREKPPPQDDWETF